MVYELPSSCKNTKCSLARSLTNKKGGKLTESDTREQPSVEQGSHTCAKMRFLT